MCINWTSDTLQVTIDWKILPPASTVVISSYVNNFHSYHFLFLPLLFPRILLQFYLHNYHLIFFIAVISSYFLLIVFSVFNLSGNCKYLWHENYLMSMWTLFIAILILSMVLDGGPLCPLA